MARIFLQMLPKGPSNGIAYAFGDKIPTIMVFGPFGGLVSLLDRDDLRFEVCALLTLFTDRPESIASGISTTLVSNLLGWVNQRMEALP